MTEAAERARVEAITRSWLRTPYHNHASLKGVGADCAHLLHCVFVEAGLIEDFKVEHYAPQFFLHSREERFLKTVERHSREIAEADAKPGDVVLYKFGLCYAHGAIIVSPGWPQAIIHAHRPSRFVVLSHGLDGELSRPKRHPRFFTRW